MISDATLDRAVARAVITADQAAGLRALEEQIAPTDAAAVMTSNPGEDEALRLVTGFADIFVTIGIALFFGAIWSIGHTTSSDIATFLAPTICAWLLAEFFTRRRRMALPSIALLVVFVVDGFLLLLLAIPRFLAFIGLPTVAPTAYRDLSDPLSMATHDNGGVLIAAALGTVGLATLHYARFRVPITVAACVTAFFIACFGLLVALAPNLPKTGLRWLALACGLCAFALAMRFDLSDPTRRTRRTDIAFWLHLLAAPLVVHTLMPGFMHGFETPTVASASEVLAVFFGLSVVAVLIDRRAILVSGLLYAGVAFGKLIETLGFDGTDLLFPMVLLGLGVFILLLSAGWQPLRRAFLRLLPAGLASRLPHPLVASSS